VIFLTSLDFGNRHGHKWSNAFILAVTILGATLDDPLPSEGWREIAVDTEDAVDSVDSVDAVDARRYSLAVRAYYAIFGMERPKQAPDPKDNSATGIEHVLLQIIAKFERQNDTAPPTLDLPLMDAYRSQHPGDVSTYAHTSLWSILGTFMRISSTSAASRIVSRILRLHEELGSFASNSPVSARGV
jgi:hypothetical protein